MDDEAAAAAAVRILRAGEGEAMGDPAGVRDRFLIDGEDAGDRFALVQHLFPPRALLAPVHLHHLEDEYTFVLSGRIGGILGEDEVFAEPGDLVFKPRNQWHTLWNAGDEPAVVLELISPAGLEKFFRWIDSQPEFPAPEVLAEVAAPYRCDVDPERTQRIVEQHGLAF
jgi:mannose-6-phosphate isomerase-like protein (cupin superfamily)